MPREREPWQVYGFIACLCASAPLALVLALAGVRWLHLPAALAILSFVTGTSALFGGLSAIAFVALRLRLIRRADGKFALALKPKPPH